MDGIICVYKQSGWTSFDAVAKLKHILHTGKIGHTGTLDPMAEGVLLVCVGSATKAVSLFDDMTKEYVTCMRLGVATDTEDLTGNINKYVNVKMVPSGHINNYGADSADNSLRTITMEEISKCVSSFKGEYMQIPPMYSAKSVDGKRLYGLARAGITVKREPVKRYLEDIEVICDEERPSFNDENNENEYIERSGREYLNCRKSICESRYCDVYIRVSCSRGTYIRTLCSDIGERLGLPACMKNLKRTRVGNFTIQQSLLISEIEKMADNEDFSFLQPVDAFFDFLPAYRTKPGADKWLLNGNSLLTGDVERIKPGDENNKGINIISEEFKVRMYTSDMVFIGLYKAADVFMPVKMFYVKGSAGNEA